MTPSRSFRSKRAVLYLGLAWIAAGASLHALASCLNLGVVAEGGPLPSFVRNARLASIGTLVGVLGLVMAAAAAIALWRPSPVHGGRASN